MSKIKSDDQTYRDYAHGYVSECLYAWGAQTSNVRLFSLIATGALLGKRGTPEFRGISDGAHTVLDEVFINLGANHKAIMKQNYKHGRRMTIAENAKRLGLPYSTYRDRLQYVIEAATRELLSNAR